MVAIRSVKVAFIRLVKAAESVAAGPMASRAAPGSLMKWVICMARLGGGPGVFQFGFFGFSSGLAFHQHRHLNPAVLQPCPGPIFSSSLDLSK